MNTRVIGENMNFLLRGNIIHTPTKDAFEVVSNGFILVIAGKCQWIKETLPPTCEVDFSQKVVRLNKDSNEVLPFYDYRNHLIIPSFIDLHVHAPQYIQMGIGLDLPLIDWLYNYTFRNEERYANVNYGKKCYPEFVNDLYEHGSLRSVIFATIHRESNQVLVEELHKKGLCALVGKVNMNRFAPVSLVEETARSTRETKEFIKFVQNLDDSNIRPIITPRFAPSCTPELLENLGALAKELRVPVQSHLCETKKEIAWVKELFEQQVSKEESTYSDVYLTYGLFGQQPTVMAHGVYLDERDERLVMENNVFIAHCPTSNANLSSGIMPLAKYLDQGLNIGLGSDVGAGHTLAMNQVVIAAIAQAKILHIYSESRKVTESEAFYLATRANGKYFEQIFIDETIGCFEPGASFDALVIEDTHMFIDYLTPVEQLQRFLHCGTSEAIKQRFLKGKVI